MPLVAAEAPPRRGQDRRVQDIIRPASLLPLQEELPREGLAGVDFGYGAGVFPGGPNMTREAWENFTYIEAVMLARWGD